MRDVPRLTTFLDASVPYSADPRPLDAFGCAGPFSGALVLIALESFLPSRPGWGADSQFVDYTAIASPDALQPSSLVAGASFGANLYCAQRNVDWFWKGPYALDYLKERRGNTRPYAEALSLRGQSRRSGTQGTRALHRWTEVSFSSAPFLGRDRHNDPKRPLWAIPLFDRRKANSGRPGMAGPVFSTNFLSVRLETSGVTGIICD